MKKNIIAGVSSTTLDEADKQIDLDLEEIQALLRHHLNDITDGGEILPLAAATREILENLKAGNGLVVPTTTSAPRGTLMLTGGAGSPAPLPATATPSREELAGKQLVTLLGDIDLVDDALDFFERVQRFGLSNLDDAVERIEAFQPAANSSRQIGDLVLYTKQLAERIKDGHETIQGTTAGRKYLKSSKDAQDATNVVQSGFNELIQIIYTLPGGSVPAWSSSDDQRKKIGTVKTWVGTLGTGGTPATTPSDCPQLDAIGTELANLLRNGEDNATYGKRLVAKAKETNKALADDKKRAQEIVRKNNFTIPANTDGAVKLVEALIKHLRDDKTPTLVSAGGRFMKTVLL